MNVDAKQLARVLVQSVKDKEKIDADIAEFVQFLGEHQLLDQWRSIQREIDEVWKELYGASSVRVLSAHPLTEKAEKHIRAVANGADVSTAVDERLIGGAIIRIDDKRIDGSLAGRLRRLRSQLYSKTL